MERWSSPTLFLPLLPKLKLAGGAPYTSITLSLQLQMCLNLFSHLCFPKSVKGRCLAGDNSMAQRWHTLLGGGELK